jgi:septum formation protein
MARLGLPTVTGPDRPESVHVSTTFVLASASPVRLSVLHAAGVRPQVIPSAVDEDAVVAALSNPDPDEVVVALAAAKASDVAARVAAIHPDSVVVGCDSMLLVDGELVGKPHTVDRARERWQRMAGRTGELLTGHAVTRLVGGRPVGTAEGVSSTTVRFGTPTAEELEAYLRTGEPLQVAGAFTLEGRGGWFIEGVDGDPSNVLGIGLPLVRRLLSDVGVSLLDVWS